MADKISVSSKHKKSGIDLSDSEDDYTPTTKKLLDTVRKRKRTSDSDEDVYAFSNSDSDSDDKNDFDIADSDVEGQEKSEDDLPDSKAWGKKKKSYYSTDYVDEDYGGLGDEAEVAFMEEEEAKNIQKRLLEQLGEDDFSFEMFTNKLTEAKDKLQEAKDKSSENTSSLIKSDLSHMSKRQKIQLLEKESPEFSGLIDDFKTKLTVAKDDLHPVLELVKDGKLPKCAASKFVKTNYDLILNYCTNISFYLLLKSQKINIQNHPVIKRLFQYRQMLNKMEPIYLEVIKPQIDKILHAVSNNLELELSKPSIERKGVNKRKSVTISETAPKKLKLIDTLEKDDGEDTGVSDDDEEYEGNDYFQNVGEKEHASKNNEESEESGFSDNDEGLSKEQDELVSKPSTSAEVAIDQDVEEKREITYQIAKNKGLTPHRKKEQRNPRVKHKLKYRKAKMRRKGAVREPKKEITRYAGEASGIKANVKKGIKIK